MFGLAHKVRIYLEYHNVRLLVRIGTPAPSPASVSPPPPEPKGVTHAPPTTLSRLFLLFGGAQIQISDLKRENQFVKRDMGVYIIDLLREIVNRF
jgi:hypothetical protein